MPLEINIKHLENGEKNYQGEIPLEELNLDTQDELIRPCSGLKYDFSAEIHEKNVLFRGAIRLSFRFECARCLTPFEKETDIAHWSQLIAFAGDDAAPLDNDCLDLTPVLREDMLLSLPQHPLCAKDCRGIDGTPERSQDSQSDQTEIENKSSAWSALDELHLE